jgi:hypothetical protein
MMTPSKYTEHLRNLLKQTIEQLFIETNKELIEKVLHLRDMLNLQEMLEAGLV